MTTEIAHGSSIISTNEVLLATLSAWHPLVSVYIDPKSDPNVASCMFSVYAVVSGVRTLIQEAGYTYDGNFSQSQRIMNAVAGAGTTIELRAKTNGNATTQAIVGVIVGWDPNEIVTPDTEADLGTNPVGGTPTTFATLSQWYPLVDVLVDSTGANPTAIGSKWELVAKFPSIAGFPDTIVDVRVLTDIKQTIFQSEAAGAETFYIQASTQNAQSGNVTAALVGHTGTSGIAPSGETIMNVAGTSANGSPGDWLAIAPGSAANTLTKATISAQRLAGGVVAMALSAYIAGGHVLVALPGTTVPASITGLAPLAGNPQDVAVDDNARSVRVALPVGGEILGGYADAQGGCSISPNQASATGLYRTYTLETFAYATPSKTVGTNVYDDTAAFDALQDSIPIASNIAARIDWGMKRYYLAGNADGRVRLRRNVQCEGRGGAANVTPCSGPRFRPLGGWRFDAALTSSDGGSSQYSRLRHLDMQSKTAIAMQHTWANLYYGLDISVDVRVAGSYVEKGTWVLAAGATAAPGGGGASPTDPATGTHVTVAFQCETGGIPTGAAPAAFATAGVADLGTIIADTGGVTWRVVSIPKDRQDSTAYVVGQIALVAGDTRYYYKCKTAGVSGDHAAFLANANFIQPVPSITGTTFLDGTVEWECHVAGVIENYAESIKIEHCQYFGGLGFGRYCESGYLGPGLTNYVFSDFCDEVDCQYWYVGGGWALHGSDANGGHSNRLRSFSQSQWQRTKTGGAAGTGEIQEWDRSLGGNGHSDGYAQFAQAPAIVADTATGATPGTFGTSAQASIWTNMRSENAKQNVVNSPALIIGSQGAQTNAGNGALFSATRCKGIIGTDTAAAKTSNYIVQAVDGVSVSTYGLQCGNDIACNNKNAWWKDSVNGVSIGVGCQGYGNGPQFDGTHIAPRMAFGCTDSDAKNTGGGPGPGVGLARLFGGFLEGEGNGLPALSFRGVDVSMLRSSRLRYGQRVLRDSFPMPGATYAVGTNKRITCTTAGPIGQIWTAGLTYYGEIGNPFTQEAILVSPSTANAVPNAGVRVWKLTGFVAQSGGVEPAWPGAGNFVDGVGNSWTDMGVECVFGPDDFIDAPGVAMVPQTTTIRTDTASTVNNTAAKCKKSIITRQATTPNNTASQLLTTLDASLFSSTLVAGDLADNATYHLELLVVLKRNASSAEGGSVAISCDVIRSGGNLVAVNPISGSDASFSNSNNTVLGTTVFLDITTSPKQIQVRASPAVNAQLNYDLEGTFVQRAD